MMIHQLNSASKSRDLSLIKTLFGYKQPFKKLRKNCNKVSFVQVSDYFNVLSDYLEPRRYFQETWMWMKTYQLSRSPIY